MAIEDEPVSLEILEADTHATRYLETNHGILSYTDLAPLLSLEVIAITQHPLLGFTRKQ